MPDVSSDDGLSPSQDYLVANNRPIPTGQTHAVPQDLPKVDDEVANAEGDGVQSLDDVLETEREDISPTEKNIP